MARILLIFIAVCSSLRVQANSCCGQSPASFPVLTLDQKLSVNTSYSVSQAAGRILSPDQFVVWDSKDRQIQTYQMSVASTFFSRHQFYINTAYLNSQYRDAFQDASSQNLSDTQLGYTYELLPEYSFHPLKPTLHTSILVNAPTGQSIYDNISLSEGTDVTGHNQWGLGLGLTAKKVYFPLTLTLQARSLRIFKKQFSSVEVGSFYDSSLALLTSYALPWKGIVLNAGVTTNHLSSRTINTGVESQTMQNTTLLVGLQKSLNDTWNIGFNYSDQTLLGPAKNSVLNKTATMNVNFNYY